MRLNILIFIFSFFFISAKAQVNFKLSFVDNNTIRVEFVPTQDYSGFLGGFEFGIQVPAGNTLTAITTNTFAAILPAANNNIYFFSTTPSSAINWISNVPVIAMDIDFTGTPGNFLIQTEGLYMDINGSEVQGIPINTALPIRLQSLTAKKFAANTSLLEWTTASEDNASHMEIERSMDAKSWSYVATEKARGSLNYSTDYSYVDAEAVLQRDRFTTVYYRLKLVDNDGFTEYSEVRSVTFDNNGIVSLEAYPNPSTEVINLRMAVGETNTNTAQMMMLDMTGKLVKKQTVSANGISVLEVDQLETGVYNIIVKHEDKTYQKRVIKTN